MISRVARLLFLFAFLAITSCSLPAEQHPRTLDKTRFPLVLEPGTSTTISPTGAQVGWVCFVQQRSKESSARLACVARNLRMISPDSLFEALAAGPTDNERQTGGYSSPVPRTARMLGASPVTADGVLTVFLSKSMADISSPNNTVAYHQIVQTLTYPQNGLQASAVAVKVDGESIMIPTDNGPKRVATLKDFNATITTPPSS